jgi:Sulfotransferase family
MMPAVRAMMLGCYSSPHSALLQARSPPANHAAVPNAGANVTSQAAGTIPPSRSTLVFVLGMGRSGTSALAGLLALCGAELPEALLGPSNANPHGHWEPWEALKLNDAFLARNQATWHDPTLRLQGEMTFSEEQRTTYVQEIQAFLRSLPPAPVLVIKDPRITALSGFWFEAARELGHSIGVAIAIRHPDEVASSLAARDQASLELSLALWLKSNLLAERASRALPRVFVDYSNLLADWRREVRRVASALSVELSFRNESAIRGFLRQDLRRQRHDGRISEVFGAPWISQVYGALTAAARDEPLDTALLDAVFDSFRASERAFRVALEEYRTRFGSAEVKRLPNITRLIHAVAGNDSQVLRSALCSQWYIERNSDVFAARCDPYEHWLVRGVHEGRLPCDDPLSLLDRLMQERMSRPGSPAPLEPTASTSREPSGPA